MSLTPQERAMAARFFDSVGRSPLTVLHLEQRNRELEVENQELRDKTDRLLARMRAWQISED